MARTALLTVLPADYKPASAEIASAAAPVPGPGMAAGDAGGAVLDARVVSSLQAMGESSPGLIKRLVEAYATSAPALMADLRRAAAAGELGAARLAAHTLKSSTANLGALGVSALFASVEAAAKAGMSHDVSDRLNTAEAQLQRVLGALKSLDHPTEKIHETPATFA